MLERLLHNPLKLTAEWTFQMESDTQRMLIEKYIFQYLAFGVKTNCTVVNENSFNYNLIRYYAMDDLVIREVLGKKLSSRHRKDLDEVNYS